MASIKKEIALSVGADAAWAALRDFGAVHTRVAPGFVTECKMDGDARIVTFANGTVARELLVDCDDHARRLVYAIAPNERIQHYSASVQVTPEGAGRSRFVWTVDLLPNEFAPYVNSQMGTSVASIKPALERAGAET